VSKKTFTVALGAAAIAAMSFSAAAEARDYIKIVGSSTVFPFASAVVENFGKTTNYPTPVIESTGSGGGLELFCEGVGVEHPDITNASRRIKESEVSRCADNGVKDIVEVKIGSDGIVVANSKQAKKSNYTLEQLFLALAKEVPVNGKLVANPHKMWSDIDPSLPNKKIEVLGPPPTSGTRDAFVEIAMEGGAKSNDFMAKLRKSDKDEFERVAHTMREDGAWIDAGENDVLIVNKLVSNPDAYGVFGFSFLDANTDRIQGNTVNGVEPTFDAIGDEAYPIARSLYFYVKKAHVGVIPGIEEYLAEFTSDKALGTEGYLTDLGLVPLPDGQRKAMQKTVAGMENLSM